MKITRRTKIKVRVRETAPNGNTEGIGSCPVCGSEVQSTRLLSGSNQTAAKESITETAKHLLRETENTKNFREKK